MRTNAVTAPKRSRLNNRRLRRRRNPTIGKPIDTNGITSVTVALAAFVATVMFAPSHPSAFVAVAATTARTLAPSAAAATKFLRPSSIRRSRGGRTLAAFSVDLPLPSDIIRSASHCTTTVQVVPGGRFPRPVVAPRTCGPRTSTSTRLSFFSRFSSAASEPEAPKVLLDPRAPLLPLFPSASDYDFPPAEFGTDDFRPDLPTGQRIVAFGDVHGDVEALRLFLVAAGVLDPESDIDDDPRWVGGTTLCVQTGDVLDRGDDELKCFRLLASLARQAKEAGGALYVLYGNHESLNAAGLFQYANPGGNAEFEQAVGAKIDYNYGSNRWRLQFAGNEPSRWATFEPGGLLADRMLSRMQVGVLLGRTVFVHAGLTADHIQNYGGIGGMNQQARDWIVKSHHGDNNNRGEYGSVEEVIAAAQARAKVAAKSMPDCLGGGIGPQSPVWMRDYSSPNDVEPKNPNAKAMIEEALKEIGPDVERMVMGHTPQNQINSALGGRAWRIDVGASRGVMSGTPEVLEIIHKGGKGGEDLVSVLKVDGTKVDGKERQAFSNVLF